MKSTFLLLFTCLFFFVGCSDDKIDDEIDDENIPTYKDEYYTDNQVVILQNASRGKGINLAFAGDGFTKKDLIVDNGKYISTIEEAMEYFFSIEPYKKYRNYFNVYMIVTESKEEGVSNDTKTVNNRFGSKYGKGTHIDINMEECQETFELINNDLTNLTTSVILNDKKYAGICYFYSNGFSISFCPIIQGLAPYNFRGVILHEMGGHGFAKLADEYNSIKGRIPQDTMDKQKKMQADKDYYQNIDFTNNLKTISWSDFLGLPKYSDMGAFEGGSEYSIGVWRPEENSCMVNNIPYYNAPSRYAITKKIMELAGEEITFNDFVNTDTADKSELKTILKNGIQYEMPPFAPPVFVR